MQQGRPDRPRIRHAAWNRPTKVNHPQRRCCWPKAPGSVLADAPLMCRDRLLPAGVGVDRLGVGAQLQGGEPQDLPVDLQGRLSGESAEHTHSPRGIHQWLAAGARVRRTCSKHGCRRVAPDSLPDLHAFNRATSFRGYRVLAGQGRAGRHPTATGRLVFAASFAALEPSCRPRRRSSGSAPTRWWSGRGRPWPRRSVPAEPSRQLDIEGVEADVADLLKQLGAARVGQGIGQMIAPGPDTRPTAATVALAGGLAASGRARIREAPGGRRSSWSGTMTFNRKTGLLDAAGHEVATGLRSADGDKPPSAPRAVASQRPSRQRRNRSRTGRWLQLAVRRDPDDEGIDQAAATPWQTRRPPRPKGGPALKVA